MTMKDFNGKSMGAGRGILPGWFVCTIIALVLIADQLLKFWVKLNFFLGEDLELTSWFHLKFIENNGFAFGIEWLNKYVLTFGRIIAVVFFIWAMARFLKMGELRKGFIVSFALIIAGAAGNIFDCVFYGEIFDNPMPPGIAVLFPQGGGYAGWFEGRVVDMLYFPFFSFVWPDWVPGVGGTEFEFFQYIFNIADSAITIGVLMMLIFYHKDASIALNHIFGENTKQAENTSGKKRLK